MQTIIKKQNGFSAVEAIIIVGVVAVIGFAGWWVLGRSKAEPPKQQTTASNAAQPAAEQTTESEIRWENTSERSWMALNGTPPACPEPLRLSSPADLTKATAILYPGQERRGSFIGMGGNYKPHGGFRFDGLNNNQVTVKVPMDGYVYRGSQYLIDGEIQYTFDIVHPCGIMVRLGHLQALSDTFKAIADKFPPAAEGDSRTERVQPVVWVKAGDTVATAAGLARTNTFFDLGVFDLRKTNEASKNAAYQQKHVDTKEHTWHAVCWFDMLSSNDAKKVRSLPAGDPAAGKTSDYCK
ncbi:MAG TPA: hypothetical protein VJ836_04300 [Candidatus Saccharimonadales bacterium]|nr:hypothetical protein [Candidatus Saccharimonadales bacterium]